MMLPWLWMCLAFTMRALFRRDPVSFGRSCCQAAAWIVNIGLPPQARRDRLDEVGDYIELETWELRKRLLSDDEIGARLIWEAAILLIYGWGDRDHYRRSAATASSAVRPKRDEASARNDTFTEFERIRARMLIAWEQVLETTAMPPRETDRYADARVLEDFERIRARMEEAWRGIYPEDHRS